MSIIKCDFCHFSQYEIVYTPIGTKRNNRVCICKMCGLVFSIHDDVPYSREPNPSGDADWGNIRFCKGQRFDAVKNLLPTNATYVLDIGSSRGHFIRWMREQNPDAFITAIEPDTRIADTPRGVGFIGRKLEDTRLPENHYDFIYCCQTLEHIDSASAMLKHIYSLLSPDGTLFLEVPNIEAISYPLNIEEFFIDKHNFHFSRDVLCSYMEWIGFVLKSVNEDNLNIRIFATKGLPRELSATTFSHTQGKPLIEQYAKTIQQNREKLPDVVEKINRIMQNQKVAFWGANTILDLMVKYGGFEPNNIYCLVDKYMWENIEFIQGIPILNPEMLRIYSPDVCVVLARHSSEEIVKSARNFNIRNIIRFSDLLESVK